MTAQDEATKAREVCEHLDPRDVDGQPIRLGSMVQYAFDRVGDRLNDPTPWTTARWGMVVGVARTPALLEDDPDDVGLRITQVDATDGVRSTWGMDYWYSDPTKVRVLQ